MPNYVFMYGNPIDGMGMVGPLTSVDDTELEETFDHEDWWYVEIVDRNTAVWKPGMPDPDLAKQELDELLDVFNDLMEDADKLVSPDGALDPLYNLEATRLMRDLVLNWRKIPDDG